MKVFSFLAIAIVLVPISGAWAEFPALDAAFRNKISDLSRPMSGKSVLVSVDESLEMRIGWRLAAAIETEIVAQLISHNVKATDDDTDHRFAWLARSGSKDLVRWRKEPVYDYLLVGKLRAENKKLLIELSVFDANSVDPVLETTLTLTAQQAALDANTPDVNRKVVAYVAKHKGRPIGNGTCWTAAKDALAAAGARRNGLYGFGRQLGPQEAVLPGDILQFEKAEFRGKFHRKGLSMNHHTAIVSEIVGKDRVKVLHQNYGKQRDRIVEGTLQLDELKQGMLVISRPITEPPVLPMSLLPYRKTAPDAVKTSDGTIDLLRTCDPELDAIKGIWNCVEGRLTCHKDVTCKMQIPFDVPDAYTVRARIKRIFADNAYVVVLVVDDRQVVLTMDGFKGNQTTGLGLIGGKKENANETTHVGKIFPMGKTVEIEIIVTPNSVKLLADNKKIVNWTGDSSNLSLPKTWAVQNTQWLAVGCYMAEFETSMLTLEPSD